VDLSELLADPQMSPLRLWLALAIWGTIHPMYYFIGWFRENTWSIMAMVDAWHAMRPPRVWSGT
jgi:hypothetical protein